MAKKTAAPAQGSKLQVIRNILNGRFLERTEAVDALLVALLAREHLFMLGPPGTGKSALIRGLCGMIGGGRYFESLMGKTSTTEQLYGPYRLTALAKDEYVRNTAGQLPEAHLAFLDEIWKVSSAIGNSLLAPLNERIFHNNGVTNIPLEVCVAASNELPQGEEMGALWDRFAIRLLIHRLQDDQNWKTMMRAKASPTVVMLTIAELKVEQAKAADLEIPDEVMDLLATIRRECDGAGFYVSDRKWVQISRLVRAQAHLRGHSAVQTEDLDILQHVLWSDDKQISQVRKLVMKHCNPIGEILVDIRDAVTEISVATQKTGGDVQEGLEFHKKIKTHLKKLNDLTKEYPTNSSLLDLKQYVAQVGQKVSSKYLELE